MSTCTSLDHACCYLFNSLKRSFTHSLFYDCGEVLSVKAQIYINYKKKEDVNLQHLIIKTVDTKAVNYTPIITIPPLTFGRQRMQTPNN